MLRSFLLAPCLLICLACATPFPIENLEDGMTAQTVREIFGEPKAIETNPEGVESDWTYVHEELEIGMAIVAWIWAPLFVAVSWLPNFEWDDPYMRMSDVILHFEDEKLARWEVIAPVPAVSSGYIYQDPFPSTMFPTKDAIHHKKGHTHHHDDGC